MEEKTMSKLFISGGTVIDPETLSRFQADVLCEDGRIAAIQPAQSGAPKDARVIDASGCFVCPGFIDPHGHIDGCKYTGTLSLLQGITTTVGGNCGLSPLDIDAFLRSQTAFPIHQAEMIGLCALREAAGATDLFAPARRAQVHTLETLCERALQSGAAGVSLGPGYAPGTSLEEMEALCTMARRYGRPVAIDTRMYSMTDLHSLQEAIELAEVTGCRMIVSHFVYQYGVGVEYKALEMLELARARGVDMRLDSGMYKDWCSSIGSALFEPVTMRDNGIELRHLRVITGEHIGLVPDQALYEHLRAAHPCDAVVVNTGSEEAVYTIQRGIAPDERECVRRDVDRLDRLRAVERGVDGEAAGAAAKVEDGLALAVGADAAAVFLLVEEVAGFLAGGDGDEHACIVLANFNLLGNRAIDARFDLA